MTEQWVRYVILANVASTFFLIGLIWFVQIVHYPLLAQVGDAHFADYHAAHMRRTTTVVILPMIIELMSAALLAWQPPTQALAVCCHVGFVLVIAIWISTACLQVPRHRALNQSFNASIHRGLVFTNWFRTVVWSARGLICIFLLAQSDLGVIDRGN